MLYGVFVLLRLDSDTSRLLDFSDSSSTDSSRCWSSSGHSTQSAAGTVQLFHCSTVTSKQTFVVSDDCHVKSVCPYSLQLIEQCI